MTATDRFETLVGSQVAGYRIEALIGRGGMGAVYRAQEERLGRNVALKVIAPELAQDDRFRQRFLRESRIAGSLEHPHVIPIYQAGDDEGLLFLAMRYVEGTDLAKLLAEEGAIEASRALELLSQVAEALDAAHEQGLVHRDVKPSNVLIAEAAGREHCYLADFGLTKRVGSLSGATAAGEIVGTLDYVAPEQITGASLDERADVYSLGCVLYECVTGQPAFPRATDVALLWAHVHEEPLAASKARPELPRQLDPVLARALAKEPDSRFRTAGELMVAARSALAPGAAATRQQNRSRWALAAEAAIASPGWRRRLVLAAATLALAGLVGTIAVLATRGTTGGLAEVRPNHVGLIDPETNEVTAEIPVGIRPGPVAAGAGAIWIGNLEDRTLTKLDPGRRTAVATISLGSRTPTGVAADAGGVWIAHGLLGRLSRVDPQFGQVTKTIPIATSPVGRNEGAVAVGAGAVWAAFGDSTLARVDPADVRVTGSTVSGAGPSAIVVAGGSVWVANADEATVHRLNPRTFEEGAIQTINVGRRPTAIAYGEGAIWVASAGDDAVTRIDPSAGSITPIPVGDSPSAVATGAGVVWVANAADGTVSRIDARTNEVTRTYEIGNAPSGIAVADGIVWVTVQAP